MRSNIQKNLYAIKRLADLEGMIGERTARRSEVLSAFRDIRGAIADPTNNFRRPEGFLIHDTHANTLAVHDRASLLALVHRRESSLRVTLSAGHGAMALPELGERGGTLLHLGYRSKHPAVDPAALNPVECLFSDLAGEPRSLIDVAKGCDITVTQALHLYANNPPVFRETILKYLGWTMRQ